MQTYTFALIGIPYKHKTRSHSIHAKDLEGEQTKLRHNSIRQRTSSKFFCVCYLLLGIELSLQWFVSLIRLPWRELTFHLQVVRNWRQLLGQARGSGSTLPLYFRNQSGTGQCSPVHAASISASSCVNLLCYVKKAVSVCCPPSLPALKFFPPPHLLQSSLNLRGSNWWRHLI